MNQSQEKITKAQLIEKINRLSKLCELTTQMTSSLNNIENLLNHIVKIGLELLKADTCSIMLVDEETKRLKINAYFGLKNEIVNGTVVKIGEKISGWVAEHKEPLLLVDGFKDDPRFSHLQEREEIRSAIVVPLIHIKGRVIGVLNLNITKSSDVDFSKDDLELALTLANLVAVSIANTELFIELKEAQSHLIHAGKMSGMGQLASGILHELNNPLTSVLGTIQVLLSEIPEDSLLRNDLKTIEQSAQKCKRIARNLLQFSRQHKFSLSSVNINSIINNTLNLLEHQIKLDGIKIHKNYEENLPLIKIDVSEIEQVFFNLILNSMQAMHKDGALTISTKLKSTSTTTSEQNNKNSKEIGICFTDTGMGIKKEDLEHIFEPFFTTKEEGKGTGLGLFISYEIIQRYKGTIYAESKGVGKGVSFIIRLPLID